MAFPTLGFLDKTLNSRNHQPIDSTRIDLPEDSGLSVMGSTRVEGVENDA